MSDAMQYYALLLYLPIRCSNGNSKSKPLIPRWVTGKLWRKAWNSFLVSTLKATAYKPRCTAERQPIDIHGDSIGMKRGRRGKSREEVSVNWHDGASLPITRDGLSLRLTSNCTSLLTRLWTSHDISEMEKLTGGSLSVPPFHFSTLALRCHLAPPPPPLLPTPPLLPCLQ